jgi:membrane protein implicated in regulation of membrane protease activity
LEKHAVPKKDANRHRQEAGGRRSSGGDTGHGIKGGQKAEVDYKGELWQSISDEPLSPGQEVIILKIEGLILPVVPASGGGTQGVGAKMEKS